MLALVDRLNSLLLHALNFVFLTPILFELCFLTSVVDVRRY